MSNDSSSFWESNNNSEPRSEPHEYVYSYGYDDDDAAGSASVQDVFVDVPSSPPAYAGAGEKRTTAWSIYDTLEAPPKMSSYRPGGQLRQPLSEFKNMSTIQRKERQSMAAELKAMLEQGAVVEDDEPEGAPKLGWVKGVMIPCLLNIWGVIMFLRLGWCTGHAGAGEMTVIILLASVVTTLTTLSLSAVATNGEVKAGGAYFLISRNLGPSFGGAIGLIFSFANAVAIALYVVGFAETLTDIWTLELIDKDNDLRVVGAITAFILFCMCLYGVGWIVKLQIGLLVVLVCAMLSMVLGAFLSPTWGTKTSKGFVGLNDGDMGGMAGSGYTGGESFFSVFAVFFPAATGIMAGANISGDLKNPSQAIPLGTICAIGLSTVVYIFMVWVMAAVSTREKLKDNTLIMMDISVFGPLVIAGIFAATLSSALASLVGAPRVFQAVCKDELIKAINTFGRGRAKDDEPIKGYCLAFLIALACIAIGDLNTIAAVISQLFLLSYGFINFACFAASMSGSYGWRPGFVYYHPITAFLGGVLCVGVMFLVDYITSLVAFGLMALLYFYIDWKDPPVNWGSVNQGRVYKKALTSNFKLMHQEPHLKNWRPQVLLLTGDFTARLGLVKFASELTRHGLLMLGNIIVMEDCRFIPTDAMEAATQWVIDHDLQAFPDVVVAENVVEGARNLMLLSGVGRFRPNIICMGYQHSWRDCPEEQTEQYVDIIRTAVDLEQGVMVVRNALLIDFTVPALNKTIDVYWLGDDGGLTAILPYIASRQKLWKETPIRLFSRLFSSQKSDEVEQLQALMNKFRIPTQEISTLDTLDAIPHPETQQWFQSLGVLSTRRARAMRERVRESQELRAHQLAQGTALARADDVDLQQLLSVEEIETQNQFWSDLYMRLGEMIQEQSSDAALIFVQLHIPNQYDDAHLYMAWMEAVSHSLKVPIVFVRGNNKNVLTFDA